MSTATDKNQDESFDEGSGVGLRNGTVGNGQVSSSSSLDKNCQPWHGRLYNQAKGGGNLGAWCSKDLNKNQYLQVDLGVVVKVGSIATQGRPDYSEDGGWFVQTYTLSYSNDGDNWNNYKEFGIPKVFEGNKDSDSVVVNQLKMPVDGRYFRIKPVTWNSHIAMRMELYKYTKTNVSPSKSRIKTSSRAYADQKRHSTESQRVNRASWKSNVNHTVIANGLTVVDQGTKQTTKDGSIDHSKMEDVLEDKASKKPINTHQQTNSHAKNDEKSTSAADCTGSQENKKDINRAVSKSKSDGAHETTNKVYSRIVKQASATVTDSEGGKYIGKIKLIKKDASLEPEVPEKVEKKGLDCEITPIVKQRIYNMSSGTVEITDLEIQRKSDILNEEIKYTEDMEAKVNERIEMFREAEKLQQERDESERLELEKRKQEKLPISEETCQKMEDSSDGSPVHSESGKSDVSLERGKIEATTVAEHVMKRQSGMENGALGESWENLSIEGGEDKQGSLEIERKLEGISTEHDGYDPEKERLILEQTEEVFRSYATQGKQSPTRRPQGSKTTMLIKSFSVVQEPSEKPLLRRQISEPRTPTKDSLRCATIIDDEDEKREDETASSTKCDDTQDIEIGFVRKASDRLKMVAETKQVFTPQTSLESSMVSEVSEVIEAPHEDTIVESTPDFDEFLTEEVVKTDKTASLEPKSPRSVEGEVTESDLKDIQSGLVRRVTQHFKDSQEPTDSNLTPQIRPKPVSRVVATGGAKERSASSSSEASEPYVSESMSYNFLMKEVSEMQTRIQSAERHVAIAKERLGQCQGDSSDAIEAEEEFHEACLELSRLRKKLFRLQKQIKDSGNDIEIDFKNLDRSGAPLSVPTLKDSVKVSKECKAPPVKTAPPVDTSVYNDEGECVPEGNVLSQIKAFEKMKGQ